MVRLGQWALCAVVVGWTVGASQAQETDDGWVDLFDGQSLKGWTQRNGTATYEVEDGAIVGRTAEGSPNSFLCTDALYDDFELLFEVKVDDRLNSGVQIRSQTRGGPTGRVNGPQVEIEASGANGAEAGYIYGEAAGGWMTPESNRAPHRHFRDGEWNAYRVLAEGPRIQVWVNGAAVSDLTHRDRFASHPEGFIGLQVHSIGRGQGPFEVRWRNVRLREVDTGWTRLFNGKDLTGWSTKGNWVARPDGTVTIEPREGEEGWERFDAYLVSDKRYGDFILDLEYAYPEGGNSGVFFRIDDPALPVSSGIEAQILDCFGKEGALSHHDHGGIIRTVGPSSNASRPAGEWNRMVVMCQKSRLTVELNGTAIVDVDLSETPMSDRPMAGHLGLQDHGRPHVVRFRNAMIRELPAERR